jgi:hypothetical protein
MVTMGPGPEDGLERLLRGLARSRPPDLPLEAILERWQRSRRRTYVLGGLSVAAGLLALVLIRPVQPEEPVFLDLRVVDVSEEQAADEETSLSGIAERPRGMSGP